MSIYVEIMCNVRHSGRDPEHVLVAFCWTDRNDNAQGVSVADARREARRQGWKVGPGNYAECPNCRTLPPDTVKTNP